MSTLSGQKIKDKFGNLLHVEGGVTSTTKNVEDGTGDATALKLSTSTVEVNGTLNFTSTPATASSEQTALLINGSDDVVKRELGTFAFLPYEDKVILRQEAAVSLTGTFQAMTFASIDNTDPDTSYQFGDSTAYTGLNTSVRPSADGVYRMDVALQFTGISNAEIEIQIRVGGTAIASDKRSKGAGIDESMISFYYAKYLSSGDTIDVVCRVNSGSATLAAGSAFEILKLG